MKNKFFVLFIIICMLTMGASYHMMRRETYDTNNDGVVDNSATLETHAASYFALATAGLGTNLSSTTNDITSDGDLELIPAGGEVIIKNGAKLQVNSAGDDKNVQIYQNDTNAIISGDGSLDIQMPLITDAITASGTIEAATLTEGGVGILNSTESAALISNTAFDMTSWDGVTTIGASKNAIRDYFYLLSTGYLFLDQNADPTVTGEFLYDNTLAGIDGGGMTFYDGTRIQYVLSSQSLPSTDNYVATYNSGSQLIEWQPGGSASVAGTDTQVQFNDSASMGADAGLTYNKTTDVITVAGGVNVGASATPALIMDDSDSASEASDYSLGINSTDTGDGTEDTDIDEEIQINSVKTTIRAVVAGAGSKYEVGAAAMPFVSLGLHSALDLPAFGTDPDVATAGYVGRDSDDHSLRGYDGSAQYVYGQKGKFPQATVIGPNDLDDAIRDRAYFWSNNTPFSFICTGWFAWSDTDDTTFDIDEYDNDGGNVNTIIDDAEVATNGTGMFTGTASGLTLTVEAGHLLCFDFDDTDDPGQVKMTLIGYYNADVD